MISITYLAIGCLYISSGFGLILYNVRKYKKTHLKSEIHTVLLSQNIMLTVVGSLFIQNALSKTEAGNINDSSEFKAKFNMQKLTADTKCNFWILFSSYAPVILPFVNSFISLVVDNYMNLKMLEDNLKKSRQNIVEVIEQNAGSHNVDIADEGKCFEKLNKWLPYLAILGQWLAPLLLGASMYPMQMKEMYATNKELNRASNTCITISADTISSCNESNIMFNDFNPNASFTLIALQNHTADKENQISQIISNIYNIVHNFKNNSILNAHKTNETINKILRRAKTGTEKCTKLCVFDTNYLVMYLFILILICYFTPIIISIIILTKVNISYSTEKRIKKYMIRDNLYTIIVWTPTISEMFMSMVFCTYNNQHMKSSMLMTVANVYQMVRNFLNTRHFRKNVIKPA